VTGAPELEFLTGPLAGRRVPVQGEITVGRADTDLELTDAEVSRLHAVLRALPGGALEVEDLGSTNGTYVDEQRTTRTAMLHPGSELRVGTTVLRLIGGAPATARDTAPHATAPATADPAPPAAPLATSFATPTVRRRHGDRSAALLMGPTVLTFVAIGLTAAALLVYFVAR
jgi:hypothetical protein